MKLTDFFTADIYEYENTRFRIYDEFPATREFRESVFRENDEYPGRLLSIRKNESYYDIFRPVVNNYNLEFNTYTATNSNNQSALLLDDDSTDTLIVTPYINPVHNYFLMQKDDGTFDYYSYYVDQCGSFKLGNGSEPVFVRSYSNLTLDHVSEYPEKLWITDSDYIEVFYEYYRIGPSTYAPVPCHNKYTINTHEEYSDEIEVHQQGSCFDVYSVLRVESGNMLVSSSLEFIGRNIDYELHGAIEQVTIDNVRYSKQYYYISYLDPNDDTVKWHNTGVYSLFIDDREYGQIDSDDVPAVYDRYLIRKVGSDYNAIRYKSSDFGSDGEVIQYIESTGRYDKFILVHLDPYLSDTLETLPNGDKVYFYYVDYMNETFKCDEYEVYEEGSGGSTPEPDPSDPSEIDPNDPNLPDPPEDPDAPYTVMPLGDYEIHQSGSEYYVGRWNYKVYNNNAVVRLDSFTAIAGPLVPELSESYTDFPNMRPRFKRHYYVVRYDDSALDIHLSQQLETYLDIQYFLARFYDYDGTTYINSSYADAGAVPEIPERYESTGDYFVIYNRRFYNTTCNLAGWEPALAGLYEDTDFVAVYEDSNGRTHYTVNFYKEDDTTLVESRQVRIFATGVQGPQMPQKRQELTAQNGKKYGYYFDFLHWISEDRWYVLDDSHVVKGDENFYARYDTTSPAGSFYTITFKDFRGNDLDFLCNTGDTPNPPQLPSRVYSGNDEYTFEGWNPSTIAPVTGFATYTSVYDKIAKPQVVIRFLDYAGSVLSIQQVEYGTTATAPLVPSYTSPSSGDLNTRFNRYDFTAWSPVLASRETESHDYTAQYTATRVYRVRFFDFSDEVIQSQFLEAGATVTAPSVPGTVVSEEITYEFSAWSPSVASVSSNVDYRAIYEEVYYRIRFFDFYGSVLSIQNLYRGETPEVPNIEQTIVQNNNVYAFTEWNPAVSAVTGEVDYQPVYEQQTYNVTIRFINSVTNEVIDTQVIPAGTAVTAPQVQDFDVEPSQSSGAYTHYTFTGWQPSIASAETQSHDYSAQFSSSQSVKIEFWRVDSGAPAYDLCIKTEFVPYGGTATPPATAEPYIRQTGVATWDETVPIYSKFVYPDDIYFWVPELAQAETTSHRYEKMYDYKCQVHLIRFYGFGNQLISEDFYEANSTLTAPSVEQSITQGGKTYNFDHWTPTVPSQATASADYTAVYVEPVKDWGSSTVELNFVMASYDYRFPVVLNSDVQYGSVYLDDIKEFNNYMDGTGNSKLTLDGRIAMKWAATSGSFYWDTYNNDHCSPYMGSTGYMAINVNTGNRIFIHDDASSSNITVINDNAETLEGVSIAPNTRLSVNPDYYYFYTIKAKGNGYILLSMQGVSLAEIDIYAT